MEKRFKILRFVATVYKILAWLMLVTGVLSSIGVLVGSLVGATLIPAEYSRQMPVSGVMWGVMAFVAGLIATLLYFVMFYALGEMISLFLAIEENTRETTLWLRHQNAAQTTDTVIAPSARPGV